jgi:hypothetical protein
LTLTSLPLFLYYLHMEFFTIFKLWKYYCGEQTNFKLISVGWFRHIKIKGLHFYFYISKFTN